MSVAVTSGISVNQSKAYGDQKALDDTVKMTKTAPISGAQVQARGPGRQAGEQAVAQPQADEDIPYEHLEAIDQLARAEWARSMWAKIAEQSPTPWVMAMREAAERNALRLGVQTYKGTPNFG